MNAKVLLEQKGTMVIWLSTPTYQDVLISFCWLFYLTCLTFLFNFSHSLVWHVHSVCCCLAALLIYHLHCLLEGLISIFCWSCDWLMSTVSWWVWYLSFFFWIFSISRVSCLIWYQFFDWQSVSVSKLNDGCITSFPFELMSQVTTWAPNFANLDVWNKFWC